MLLTAVIKARGIKPKSWKPETEDKDAKHKELNLITYVEVEPADESDANALIPALESTEENGLAPKEALADSLYGSDENCCKAEQKYEVEVIAPTKGQRKKETIPLSDFTTSEDRSVASYKATNPSM